MKAKSLTVLILLLCVAVSFGCLKRFAAATDKRMAMNNYMEYGPFEFQGGRCDHAEYEVPYAPDLPHSKYLTLDVYWNDHAGAVPIVVNIHGGGWEIGDKNAANSVFRSKYLASRDFVVVNVNYRMLPEVPIQTQIEDVMGAVIWAKENADRYGGDPHRVGVMGGSAGGHLAAMVAWASDDPYFKPTSHADSEFDSDVKATVPFYAALDLEQTTALNNDALKPVSHPYFTKTADPEKRERLFEHISPKYHLDKNVPPTLFVCGDLDNFGLYPDQVAFEKKLQDLGVPAGLYTAEGAKHGFDVHHGADFSRGAMEATAAWFDKYLR